jgi:hypothetical protein
MEVSWIDKEAFLEGLAELTAEEEVVHEPLQVESSAALIEPHEEVGNPLVSHAENNNQPCLFDGKPLLGLEYSKVAEGTAEKVKESVPNARVMDLRVSAIRKVLSESQLQAKNLGLLGQVVKVEEKHERSKTDVVPRTSSKRGINWKTCFLDQQEPETWLALNQLGDVVMAQKALSIEVESRFVLLWEKQVLPDLHLYHECGHLRMRDQIGELWNLYYFDMKNEERLFIGVQGDFLISIEELKSVRERLIDID